VPDTGPGYHDAPPEDSFAFLPDPDRHTDLDGSGMLRGLVDGQPLLAIGQTFTTDIDYRMINAVTAYAPRGLAGPRSRRPRVLVRPRRASTVGSRSPTV